MTLQQWAEKHLYDHGLWPREAALIVEQFAKSEAGKCMCGRLHDDREDYPSQLLAVLGIAVKAEAITWLRANKPEHFALHGLETS